MSGSTNRDLVLHVVHTSKGGGAAVGEIVRRSELDQDQVRGALRGLVKQGYVVQGPDDPDTGEVIYTTTGVAADVGARLNPEQAARDRAAIDRVCGG